MTLRGERGRRLQTTAESYRLLLAALPEPDGAEAEMLRTLVEIAEDERALRALTDLAQDPSAPQRAGVTANEFLRCHGIHVDPAVSITVEQTGAVRLWIRDADRCYDIAWTSDYGLALNTSANEWPAPR